MCANGGVMADHSGNGITYHGEVVRFKKNLIRTALEAHRGNRTHAARALGLRRTYLLRLMRDFEIWMPPKRPYRPPGGGA